MLEGTEIQRPEASTRRWFQMDGRFLNHVALVYQPGAGGLARKLFELLGCDAPEGSGAWLSGAVDRSERDRCNNALFAAEVTPKELTFKRQLAKRHVRPRHSQVGGLGGDQRA